MWGDGKVVEDCHGVLGDVDGVACSLCLSDGGMLHGWVCFSQTGGGFLADEVVEG